MPQYRAAWATLLRVTDFIERYRDKILGVLSCFDRVVIYGSMTSICNKYGMERHLRQNDIPLERFADYFEKITYELKRNAEAIAKSHGLEID